MSSKAWLNRWTMGVCLLVLGILSLGVGGSVRGITEFISGDRGSRAILIHSRLPRLAAVVLSGMGLSVSGLILQKLSRNPFASPTTSSSVDGARLGYVVGLLFFGDQLPFLRIGSAFGGALGASALFLSLIGRGARKGPLYIPLIGMALGLVFNSVALALAYQFDVLQNVNGWLMGNFAMVTPGRYELVWFCAASVALALILAKPLMVASLGEDAARSLGLNYRKTAAMGLLISSVATASTVVVGGEIPFIGLIIPNLVSRFRGDHLERSLPETVLAGALFLLVADLFSRLVIHPFEIPVGLTAGIAGALIFVFSLFRKDREN